MADQLPDRVLWVYAPHFSSRLVLHHHETGLWVVVCAGPSLENLFGLEHGRVKRFLDGKGWSYEWGDPVNA